MILNNLEEEIVVNTASAMFGIPGKEELRMGGIGKPRTLGIGWLIYGFVRASMPETVVEIGAGGSTACILWGLKHNEKGHLDTCDVFLSDLEDRAHYPQSYERDKAGESLNHNHAEVLRWLRKWQMEDICTIHHESSKDFVPRWNRPIDMVVVDGDHSLEFIKNDAQLLKHLRPGGYALFHDFLPGFYQIGKAILEWVHSSDEWSLIVEPSCLSMAIVQRRYSIDPKMTFAGWALSQSSNPNNVRTPFQFTDPRYFCVTPWAGDFYPDPETYSSFKPEGMALAEKIMAKERETGRIVEGLEEING